MHDVLPRLATMAVLLVVLAGCGNKPAARQKPVSAQEWKRVIRDAYDGRIDHPHRCVAVRKAIAHIPHDNINFGAPGSPSGAMLRLEKRVCEIRRLQRQASATRP